MQRETDRASSVSLPDTTSNVPNVLTCGAGAGVALVTVAVAFCYVQVWTEVRRRFGGGCGREERKGK